jgi:diguanylate cyclase (GGDEF)-like protein/PAS domain S-box-containing protein
MAGVDERLEAALTRSAPMAVLGVRTDGRVVYANPAVTDVVGFAPEELVGTNLIDYLHPDDAERAVLTLSWGDADGPRATGTTGFRTRTKSGDYVDVETTGSQLVFEDEDHLAVYVRRAEPQNVAEAILAVVASGSSRVESLTAALASVSWAELGSHIAIAWPEDGAMQQVDTGLQPALTGVETSGAGNPWGDCLRTRAPVRRCIDDVDRATAAAAARAGLAEIWVQPVTWSDVEAPALVTIWAQGGARMPELHGYGMRMACNFTELVLRFTARTRLQEELATHDALTGLVNRRAFLERVAETSGGGVVLYCDLDRFKPVNDELGHAAGDLLLRAAGERIGDCLRSSDVVARLGGDEFAVLCDRASPASAMSIARRIIAAFRQPFLLDDRSVSVGITIGVAHGSGTLTDEVIDRADRALRAAKAGRRTAVVADWERSD